MHTVTNRETGQDIQRERPANGFLQAAIRSVANLAGITWSPVRGSARRRLQVVETLALGAKKQLVLVSCDGEHFLVGTGSEQVQTIVRLKASTSGGDCD